MWNEKEFFEDFVKESEKLQPDKQFVAQLKDMARDVEEDESKASKWRNKTGKRINIKVYMYRYIAIAVIVILCVTAGGITWNTAHKSKSGSGKSTNTDVSGNIHAGTHDKDIHSGIIGDKKGISQASMLLENDSIIVTDEYGKSISTAKRKIILKWLNMSEKTDEEIDANTDYVSYFCKGEEEMEIRIYDEEYIVIAGEDDIYKIMDSFVIP